MKKLIAVAVLLAVCIGCNPRVIKYSPEMTLMGDIYGEIQYLEKCMAWQNERLDDLSYYIYKIEKRTQEIEKQTSNKVVQKMGKPIKGGK